MEVHGERRVARFIRGCVVHTPSRGVLEVHPDAFIAVDATSGRITTFHKQIEDTDLKHFEDDGHDALVLEAHQFLMPGFVDTHVHAPQYQYMGTGTDTPLMQWLDKYTFPVEASFADVEVATTWYTKLLDRMLAEGITTAQYFATIHLASTKRFADLIEARGQRGLVGLVSMDRNAPSNYVSPSTETSLRDAETFIQYTLNKQNELVRPVVTPRFIPTCTRELLRGLGDLAERYDVRIQSHIAESHDEEAFVELLHPGERDTQIFQSTMLLNPRSCMAHAVHLTDTELEVIHETGASIAHCPLSNFFFANGFLDVRRCWSKQVAVGLGTDIAGGYSPSMLRAIQTAVLTSKALEITRQTTAIDFKDAFWIATMGGAEALGIAEETGSFAVGKCLDAVVVDTKKPQNLDFSDRDTTLDIFQKVMHNGDSRNFTKVLVRGRVVHQTE